MYICNKLPENTTSNSSVIAFKYSLRYYIKHLRKTTRSPRQVGGRMPQPKRTHAQMDNPNTYRMGDGGGNQRDFDNLLAFPVLAI